MLTKDLVIIACWLLTTHYDDPNRLYSAVSDYSFTVRNGIIWC